MPRFLVQLESGAEAASVQTTLMSTEGVTEATPSRTFNGLIVDADAGAKQRIADQPGVQRVYDDIQALPQVADQTDREEFLRKIREHRQGDDAPPLVETEPAEGNGSPRTDGGSTRLPAAPQGEKFASGEPQLSDTVGALDYTGAVSLHDDGITGNGVIIAVLDTGVEPSQFAEERRMRGADLTDSDDPWNPITGHGTMSAGIAAGGPETSGVDPGFAPDADVFPLKSTLSASELMQAQDEIINLRERTGRPVVVSNSWGFEQCEGLCDHPVTASVRESASYGGVYHVNAAGNQGRACGQDCELTGICGPQSIDGALAVGATGANGDPQNLHAYSSRGGVEASCGTRKPDVSAPVYGTFPWGEGTRDHGNTAGTSAAAPMVSGAVALLIEDSGGTPSSSAVFDAIRENASGIEPSGWNGCTGYGNLNVGESRNLPSGGVVQSGFAREAALVLGVGLGSTLLADRLSRGG